MGIFAFGLERIGLVSVRTPLASLIVLIVVTVVAIVGVFRVTFDDDLRRLFRSQDAVFKTYERLQASFPTLENQLIVVAESKAPLSGMQLSALRDLHLDLQFVDNVSGVASLFTLRKAADGEGDPNPIFPADLPDGPALESLIEQARAHPQFSTRLLADDNRAAMLFVSLSKSRIGIEETQSLLGEIGTLLGETSETSELRLTTTGSLAIRQEIKLALKRDLYLLTLVGLLVSVAVCTFFFRRPKLVLISSLPPVIAVAWVIGGYGLGGYPITTLNNVLPTLVLVIAFSDSVHMVQAIRRKTDRGANVTTAAREAVMEVGPACAMTSVTTMIACLSLTLSSATSVREFAVAGTIAIFMAFLSVITIVPALAVLLIGSGRGSGSVTGQRAFGVVVNSLTDVVQRFVRRRSGLISVASVPLLMVTGALYFMVDSDYDYRTYLVPDSPANQVINLIDKKLGGANAVYVLVEDRSGGGGLETPVEILRAIERTARDDPGFRSVISLAGIVDATGTGQADKLIDRLPRHISERLISQDGRSHLVTLFMPASSAIVTRQVVGGLDKALAPIREQYPDYGIEPTGIVAVGAFESERMIGGLKESLAAAVMVTMFVIAISLRSVLLAAVSAVPNLLSLTVVAAALYVFGSAFQIVSVLALTIAFGIAVDNTIHLLNRYQLERARGGGDDALDASIRTIGPILFATTVILSAGFGVTQLSALPMVEIFGRLCIFVISTALVAALVVLPASVISTRFHLNRP